MSRSSPRFSYTETPSVQYFSETKNPARYRRPSMPKGNETPQPDVSRVSLSQDDRQLITLLGMGIIVALLIDAAARS